MRVAGRVSLRPLYRGCRGDDGSGVCVEANAEPSQAVRKARAARYKTWWGQTRPHEFDELWPRRLALAPEIVEVPATKIHCAIFQSDPTFRADGELRLGLTEQHVEDCDLALVVEDETERALKAGLAGLM